LAIASRLIGDEPLRSALSCSTALCRSSKPSRHFALVEGSSSWNRGVHLSDAIHFVFICYDAARPRASLRINGRENVARGERKSRTRP
jgi:hypothetical protein